MFDKAQLAGIGQRIKNQRLDKDFTLDKLGKKVGLTKSTISKIENGEQMPSIEQLVDIANALESRLEYMLGLDNIPDTTTEHLISGISLFKAICTTKAYTGKRKKIIDREDFVFHTNREYLMLTGNKKLFTLIQDIAKAEIAKTKLTPAEYQYRIRTAKKHFEQDKSTTQNESYFLITGEQMTEIIEAEVKKEMLIKNLLTEIDDTEDAIATLKP